MSRKEMRGIKPQLIGLFD